MVVLFWVGFFWQQIIFSLVYCNPLSLTLTHFLVQSLSQNQSQNGCSWKAPREIISSSSSRVSQRRLPSTVPSFEHLHRWELCSISGQPVPKKLKPTFHCNTKHMQNSYRPMADPFTTTLDNPSVMTVQF